MAEHMNNKNRQQRLRNFLKKLNKERKKQAKQIDMLCNDLISSQRDFIKRLKTIDFRANFYESIIGMTDLNDLLTTATDIIKDKMDNANVVFFLNRSENFEIFSSGDSHMISPENCFSPELMKNICLSNKICNIEDMFAMGLQGNLTGLNTISAFTIPLGISNSSQGFILIYRSLEKKLTREEIKNVSAIINGLAQAIYSCQTIMHS